MFSRDSHPPTTVVVMLPTKSLRSPVLLSQNGAHRVSSVLRPPPMTREQGGEQDPHLVAQRTL
jgi:hypothetical protein